MAYQTRGRDRLLDSTTAEAIEKRGKELLGLVLMALALMAAAMMAPTALPAFATYDDLGRSTQTRFGALVAGYMIVWLGFSVLAGGLQMGLYGLGLISAFGDSLSVWLSAGLLLVAGLYQFSPVKEACLSKCRAPLTFFMAHWDEGPLRNGLRLGLVCLGCCWALMLVNTALAFDPTVSRWSALMPQPAVP
jgi:predicted metal-binding membrane protein